MTNSVVSRVFWGLLCFIRQEWYISYSFHHTCQDTEGVGHNKWGGGGEGGRGGLWVKGVHRFSETGHTGYKYGSSGSNSMKNLQMKCQESSNIHLLLQQVS